MPDHTASPGGAGAAATTGPRTADCGWQVGEIRVFFAARASSWDARFEDDGPAYTAALAARHGRAQRPDEPLSAGRLSPPLAAAGWQLVRYYDPPHRFLATATRAG